MSRRKKLEKFSEILRLPNVFENYDYHNNLLMQKEGEEVVMSGKWNKHYFKNENPLVLELACGYGEYAVHLGEHNPAINYIGVDVKGNRIYKGAKMAEEQDLSNVAFLRTRIEHIEQFFAPKEVNGIWITFPDPFLKASKSNRRLTSLPFLEKYRQILANDGFLYLKTDSTELYDFSMEILKQTPWVDIVYNSDDIYNQKAELYLAELELKTRYERIHMDLGKKIKFIHFRFNE